MRSKVLLLLLILPIRLTAQVDGMGAVSSPCVRFDNSSLAITRANIAALDGQVHRPDATAETWHALACARLAMSGFGQSTGESWLKSALDAAGEGLFRFPHDAHLLGFVVAAGSFATRPESAVFLYGLANGIVDRWWNRGHPDLGDVEATLYRGILDGNTQRWLFSGCRVVAMYQRDYDTAHHCGLRAAAADTADQFALLHLAWMAFRRGDAEAGKAWYASAAALPANMHDLQFNRSLGNQRALGATSPAERLLKVFDDDMMFRPCQATDSELPCSDRYAPPAARDFVIAAQRYRLWDSTGTLIINVPLAITASGDRPRDVTIELLQFAMGRPMTLDTSFVIPGASDHSGTFTRACIVGTGSATLIGWSVMATSDSGRHRSSAFADVEPPVIASPVSLSDVVVSRATGDALRCGAVPVNALDALDRREPIHVFYQIRTVAPDPGYKTVIAVRKSSANGGKALIEARFPANLRAGIVAVDRDIDVSRLGRGSYRLEVRIEDTNGKAVDARTRAFVLQ